MSSDPLTEEQRPIRVSAGTERLIDLPIPPEVRETLSSLERLHFELARRMNREPWKGIWTWCQRVVGATWIAAVTGRLLQVEGIEHVRDAYPRGPLLLVANHRSYFDMFVVSSLLYRALPGSKRLTFPVTGQYYYQSLGGVALNQFAAFWSMFPPLFALPSHTVSDRYALDLLVELCRRGPGQILGIHPEGGRNLGPDPYEFLRCQPGTGRIIHAARPIVIPCFIAGLDNDVVAQVRRNWSGGEPVRVWFDEPVDLDAHYALPGKGSTYKQITETVMTRVQALAERDRARHAPSGAAFGDTAPPVPPDR